MLRVSASDLESLRHYESDNDWMTFDKLLASLQGKGQPTRAMQAGTAWHNFLETAEPGDYSSAVGVCDGEGFQFNIKFDSDLYLPPIRECKVERTFDVCGMPVTLVGMADCVHGRTIDDHKLTATFDTEKYEDSLQWRTYLLLFGADRFNYNVFEASDTQKGWNVNHFHRFTVYRYPDMERDVLRALTNLTQFIREYVPQRINDPLAAEKLLPF